MSTPQQFLRSAVQRHRQCLQHAVHVTGLLRELEAFAGEWQGPVLPHHTLRIQQCSPKDRHVLKITEDCALLQQWLGKAGTRRHGLGDYWTVGKGHSPQAISDVSQQEQLRPQEEKADVRQRHDRQSQWPAFFQGIGHYGPSMRKKSAGSSLACRLQRRGTRARSSASRLDADDNILMADISAASSSARY